MVKAKRVNTSHIIFEIVAKAGKVCASVTKPSKPVLSVRTDQCHYSSQMGEPLEIFSDKSLTHTHARAC